MGIEEDPLDEDLDAAMDSDAEGYLVCNESFRRHC